MARATLAPVIGSPASWSQKIVWRYSSSATVAWSWDMALSISSAPTRIDATTRPRDRRRRSRLEPRLERHEALLGQRHELAPGRRELGVAAGDEGERVVQRWVERDAGEMLCV